jgi:Flp pilus assembly protein TadD
MIGLSSRTWTVPLPMAAVALSVCLLVSGGTAPAGEPSPHQLMKFGLDAARQGLWREAVSRWERAARVDSTNARLRSNLAVGYESLGRFEDADHEYRQARLLDPQNALIRDNHMSFLQLHPSFKRAEDAVGTAPEPEKR